ncbi:glycoside hydrolase family 28 protein [Hydnomerulius pinastri MD-312]|uniref:galacturonan 1,4-alpha-galacturonidase n=1 Tax=Hydnomerulius pinastri MD-312 TaxID=994086 RepID=A0A0C9W875_9AGAM|nr:glycoside hydrolase family 28 protein [Hydnomerulius pinastri MD-312]
MLSRNFFLLAFLSSAATQIRAWPGDNGVCTIIPNGNGRDDSDQILAAINAPDCNEILLPQPYTYSIQQRLLTDLSNKVFNVYGTLLFSDDLAYWINNSWVTDFDTLQTAWIATGDNWVMSGGGFNQGGIDGNGQAWYTRAQGYGNQPGRPMSLYISNATNALVKDFSIRQPQFWAFFVDQSKNITLDGVYVNATNHDPAEPPADPRDGNLGNNWVINTDGIDTYRSDQITITNWVVQNGDDCVAYKGNSTNIFVSNVTCHGGNGIAFGSLGQYQNRTDNVENITMIDINLLPSNVLNGNLTGAAYFKAWVGVSMGTPPNGGGGGTGLVNNVTLENFTFQDADLPVYLQSCLTYSAYNVTQYCNTSTLEFENVVLKNFQGTSSGVNNGSVVSLVCSPSAPCQNFDFVDFNATVPAPYTPQYTCDNAVNVTGIDCISSSG